MRWGPVSSWWWKPLKELKLATFNARAETFATKPMFRSAFKRNRCLIPVSGYYEWQDTLGGKQLWYFTARDGSRALTIAGLGDEWQDMEADKSLKSSTMIITEPNKFVAEVHDRMPVLLAEKDYAPWLSGKAGLELLKPAAENVLEKAGFKAGQQSGAPDDDSTLIDKHRTKWTPAGRNTLRYRHYHYRLQFLKFPTRLRRKGRLSRAAIEPTIILA